MTWEELKEKGKELGDKNKTNDIIHIKKNGLYFCLFRYGSISIMDGRGSDITVINRTPDQMWQIMEALQ